MKYPQTTCGGMKLEISKKIKNKSQEPAKKQDIVDGKQKTINDNYSPSSKR